MRKGDLLDAKAINQNIARGPMRGFRATGGVDKRNFPNGIALDVTNDTTRAAHSQFIRWAEIQSVGEDHLQVKMYDTINSVATSNEFAVAKAFLLQQSKFDGETISYIDGDDVTYTKDATNPTYKRNHDDGTDSEDFVVTPNWYVGEPIIIIRIPTYVNGVMYNWIELSPGRYWARQ